MKKIVSTKGYTNGKFVPKYTNIAIRERVNNILEYLYNQNTRNGEIRLNSDFSYMVFEGEVVAIHLSYSINNPTPQRLEDFRDTCNSFYEVNGFKIDDDGILPSKVSFWACDIYDMASLIHAIQYHGVSLESIICAIDSDLTEKDAIYSSSGSYLLQLPDIPYYRVKEGPHYISPSATRYCTQLRQLDLPLGFIGYNDEVLSKYQFPLEVKVWDTHYDGTPAENEEELDDDDEPYVVDEHEVAYSTDGKRLLFCRKTFNDIKYEVPDGVEEISDFAFLSCRHFVELSIPRSVRIIGDYIFGEGGIIIMRDE